MKNVLGVFSSVCPSLRPPSIRPSIHLSIHLFTRLSVSNSEKPPKNEILAQKTIVVMS